MVTTAYVNHGRWVADCPDIDCPEAHQVSGGDVFQCVNCGASGVVEFPDCVDVVDAVLAVRPVPQTRNWTPDETVEDLQKENEIHGLVDT